MREVLFICEADHLALATSHLGQSSSTSRDTAAQAGFFILSPLETQETQKGGGEDG
jgi:hypothetical protein